MTVSGIQTVQSYPGPIAVAVVLSVPFIFFDHGDLLVFERIDATGVETLLVEGTHYTVSGGAGATGSIETLTGIIGAGDTLFIVRKTARTQALDYQSQTKFPAASHEEGLDRAALRDQEGDLNFTRTLRVKDTDIVPAPMPVKFDRAGKFLSFDASGNPQATTLGVTLTGVSAFIAAGFLLSVDAPAARAALVALGSSGAQTIGPGGSLTISAAGISFLALDSTALGAGTYRLFRLEPNITATGNHGFRKQRPDAGGADIILNWSGSVLVSDLIDEAQSGGELLHTGVYEPRNLLLNSAMRVWQVGGSGGSIIDGSSDAVLGAGNKFDNNKHGPDGWKIFGGDPVGGGNVNGVATWQRDASGPSGQGVSARATLQIAGHKFAIAQIIERSRMPQNIKNWSLALQVRSPGGLLGTIKYAVIAWALGDDAPDWANFITNWTGALTLGANWSKLGVDSFAPTNVWQRTATEDITAAGSFSSAANIGIMIWMDDAGGLIGEQLFQTDISIQPGPRITPFNRVPIEEDYELAHRYFIKTFDEDVVPVEQGGSQTGTLVGRGLSANASRALCHWNFPTTMRAAPTMRAYKPTAAGTAGRWSDDSIAATFQNVSRKAAQIIGNDATTEANIHATADARI